MQVQNSPEFDVRQAKFTSVCNLQVL